MTLERKKASEFDSDALRGRELTEDVFYGDPADWLQRAFKLFSSPAAYRRDAEQFGDLMLSVQANETAYCTPREGDASWPLELYSHVEIAMWPAGDGPRLRWITKPSEFGIEGFDDLWTDDDVAGWVPIERVIQLQEALRRRAADSEVSA